MTWGVSGPRFGQHQHRHPHRSEPRVICQQGNGHLPLPVRPRVERGAKGRRLGGRIRSYSMNAMIGNAGNFSTNGFNVNNPDYIQFFKITQIPQPTEIFVFLDEHPDSINDGYFLDKSRLIMPTTSVQCRVPKAEWPTCPPPITTTPRRFRLPTDTARCIAGCSPGTIRPPLPDALIFPFDVSANQRADFDWVLDHMSVDNN